MPETYNAAGLVYNESDLTYDGDAYGPLPFPIVGVYIAFNDGPYVANPAWTEITNYVRAISTRRGRSDDFEQFDTGTAQLVLDNRDRRFDPFYTSGPYYLKLTPRRQIRIVGQANGVNYDIFRGFVAGWPVAWTDAGYDSTVTIQAFDALGLMAGEVVPTDWTGVYTESLTPRHYWKCDDSQGSQILTDQIMGTNISKEFSTDPAFFEQPSLANGLVGSSAYCERYITPSQPAGPNVGDTLKNFALAGWIQFSGSVSSASNISYIYGASFIEIRRIQKDFGTSAIGDLRILFGAFPWAYTYTISQQLGSTFPYHIVINANSTAQTLEIWVNGRNVTGTRTAASAGYSLGGADQLYIVGQTVQEISTYSRLLTSTEIDNLYNFGSGRVTETTTARMNRLINTTEWSPLLTGFTSTPAASVSEIGTGNGVVPEMQLVADSEGGDLYVSKSGVLTMTNRTDVFNAPRSSTPQATITDSGAGLGYGTELQIDYDADALSNDVTVTFSGNGEVNAYSDAVIEAYGAAATTIETQLADPISASQLATRQLGVQGSLVPRISPLDLSVNTSQSDWQTILGLELLDRVTFKRTPTVGNQFSREALVNAIEHTIEPGSWSTSVQLSMRYTSPLICDDDVLGTVDFNYCG